MSYEYSSSSHPSFFVNDSNHSLQCAEPSLATEATRTWWWNRNYWLVSVWRALTSWPTSSSTSAKTFMENLLQSTADLMQLGHACSGLWRKIHTTPAVVTVIQSWYWLVPLMSPFTVSMLNHYMPMEAYSDSFVDKQRRTIKGYEFKPLIIIQQPSCHLFFLLLSYWLQTWVLHLLCTHCLNKTKNNLKVIWQMMKNRNLFYLMVHLLLTDLGAAFQTVGDAFLT